MITIMGGVAGGIILAIILLLHWRRLLKGALIGGAALLWIGIVVFLFVSTTDRSINEASTPSAAEITQQEQEQRVYQQYDCNQPNRDVFDDFFREQKGCGQPKLIEKPVSVRP